MLSLALYSNRSMEKLNSGHVKIYCMYTNNKYAVFDKREKILFLCFKVSSHIFKCSSMSNIQVTLKYHFGSQDLNSRHHL